ncbi:PDR/VanB family oxidoreductase [Qaidamihabitans albus]|uniref:PDR/VanB family oxidoreductase n=1 Tax=Qaidamihabitans albus TaxID=2795733 RepID=UPI0018F11A3F|nr:PDR/VanB family oxidoreductase [Qaidamihabitans albus]
MTANLRSNPPAGSVATRGVTPFEGDVVIRSRRAESDGVVSLELVLPTRELLPAWRPGAHIDVVLPNGLTRQYSLCGSVEDRESWRIGVLREPGGRGVSQWIHDHAGEGTRLRVRGPRNNFPLLPARRYLFLGGGIGITPLLPMVAEADASGADWVLHYGGRTRSSMAFLDELARHGDRVVITPQDEAGMLDLAAVLDRPDESTVVYCCGPSGLIDAVELYCRSWPPGALHVERFVANQAAAGAENQPVEVELAATGLTVTVPPECSVLEAVEKAGVRVASSCTEGICGSCETPVLEGEPEHRDSVLTDEERADGDIMMICVSRARGGRLVLDL